MRWGNFSHSHLKCGLCSILSHFLELQLLDFVTNKHSITSNCSGFQMEKTEGGSFSRAGGGQSIISRSQMNSKQDK